ncbi:protein of unknown function [Nitrospira japonica]|uniref:Uncharacterized protein n=1 Tax=Nitrospira japonica TaxID=1325564 RepID=A0A1W1IB12_9BACT|nr:protein of unknown function [Nitrospira japonica]
MLEVAGTSEVSTNIFMIYVLLNHCTRRIHLGLHDNTNRAAVSPIRPD